VGGDADRREQWLAAVLGGLIVVALAAGLGAVVFHKACFDPGPPVGRPVPGSQRAGFCSAVESTDPWLSLTLGPILIYLLLVAALRQRRLFWTGLAALALSVAVLSIAAIADWLEFYPTTI